MSKNKKINFKVGVESLVRNHFPGLKMENPGMDLISNLISNVSVDIITFIEKDYKSAKLMDVDSFRHLALKAINKIFPGVLARNALSEALKQVALLQSGCMIYGDDDRVKQQMKRGQESDLNEIMKRQKTERLENQFRKGVKKAFALLLPTLSIDAESERLLAHRIRNFGKIVADQASKSFEKKEELQPVDIKNVISKYLETKALSAANCEGNKNLVLFANGLLDFKPRRTIKSGWSEETIVQERILISVFKPGIKSLISDTSPDAATDSKAPKYLGHALMEVAKYLAETTAEICKKKKITEIGNEELSQALTATFPEQLRQHAILHASDDVANYMEGLILYEREPEKPIRPKSRKPPAKRRKLLPKKRSKPAPSKRTKSKSSATKSKSSATKSKSSATKSKSSATKSKSSATKSKSSATKSKNSVTKSGRKKERALAPKKSAFASLLIETIPTVFPSAEIVLVKDASNRAGGMLEDVLQALESVTLIRAENSEELSREQVVEAVFEVLPKQLAEHAVAFGSTIQSFDIV